MKYSEISKLLKDNDIHYLQVAVAKEVSVQLGTLNKKVSEDAFNRICETVHSTMTAHGYAYEILPNVTTVAINDYNSRGELTTRGGSILNKVLEYINKARSRCPEITNDMLSLEGAVVYDNINAETASNWSKGYTCPFCLTYKETGLCFIKVFVNKKGVINGYLYLNKGNDMTYLEAEPINQDDALYLATLLQLEADEKNIYGRVLSEIDFDRELTNNEILRTL